MKTVILAGGFGTRLAEETSVRPKPMVEIGGRPIIWHIMHQYLAHGFNDFYVALGYLGDYIKRYFMNYHLVSRDMSISMKDGKVSSFGNELEDWTVHLIDTGLNSMTGGRVYRLREYLQNETFMLTYGDGVSTVDVHKLIEFHRDQGKIATLTAVRPPGRFGGMDIQDGHVIRFEEKSQTREGWINGGFMVFEPEVFQYIEDEQTVLESYTLEKLAEINQLAAYQHEGFWQCMDTLRDKKYLQEMWDSGKAPWKIW